MMGRQAWTEERTAVCYRLRGEGLSFSQIAHELGVTRAAVSGFLDRHGAGPLKNLPKAPEPKPARLYKRRSSGTNRYEVPEWRPNDDNLHLTLMLAALREQSAA